MQGDRHLQPVCPYRVCGFHPAARWLVPATNAQQPVLHTLIEHAPVPFTQPAPWRDVTHQITLPVTLPQREQQVTLPTGACQ